MNLIISLPLSVFGCVNILCQFACVPITYILEKEWGMKELINWKNAYMYVCLFVWQRWRFNGRGELVQNVSSIITKYDKGQASACICARMHAWANYVPTSTCGCWLREEKTRIICVPQTEETNEDSRVWEHEHVLAWNSSSMLRNTNIHYNCRQSIFRPRQPYNQQRSATSLHRIWEWHDSLHLKTHWSDFFVESLKNGL